MENVDWKLKLMQVLDCVGDQTGYFFDGVWKEYGVTDDERKQIEAAFGNYKLKEAA